MSTPGAMIFCAHQALLGTPQDPDLLEVLAAQSACPCGTPVVRRGARQLAVASAAPGSDRAVAGGDLVERIVTEWDNGISLAGALIRAASALDPATPPLTALATSDEQVAALAWRTPIRYAALGGGRYSVTTNPGRAAAPNDEHVPPDSVLLLDPCGPVLTSLHLPAELPR